MDELKIDDTSYCYVCGAKEIRNGCSLHCWDVEYECGCIICGAISDSGIYLNSECPNLKIKT